MTLKELLGDLFTPEIEAKLNSHTVYLWNKSDDKEKDKEPIPKFRVNEMTEALKANVENLTTQIKTLEETITARDKDLKDLKKAADGNTELTNQITELQNKSKTEKENWEKEKQSLSEKEKSLRQSMWLQENLLDAGVSDPDARKTLALKIQTEHGEKLEYDEKGVLRSRDEILKPIKENKAFAGMFGEEIIAGQRHQQTTVHNNGNDFYTREEIQKMTAEQMSDPKVLEKVNKSLAINK